MWLFLYYKTLFSGWDLEPSTTVNVLRPDTSFTQVFYDCGRRKSSLPISLKSSSFGGSRKVTRKDSQKSHSPSRKRVELELYFRKTFTVKKQQQSPSIPKRYSYVVNDYITVVLLIIFIIISYCYIVYWLSHLEPKSFRTET